MSSTPKRMADGCYVFPKADSKFKPNRSPAEVLQAGAFGGTYFRSIYSSVTKQRYRDEVWKEFPKSWFEGMDIRHQVTRPWDEYSKDVNKYGAKCGATLEEWETSDWMRAQDPYGWFQWYCRFWQGRRSPDDERQIKRWMNACDNRAGRWKNNLLGKIIKANAKWNDNTISPVIRQTLLHWGYEITAEDVENRRKVLKDGKPKAKAKPKKSAVIKPKK